MRALILGCAGPVLSAAEGAFFRQVNPWGFILFARNCQTPDQVRTLVLALREAVARPDAPVLIDQEGGRVLRLKPPHWRAAPAAAVFGALWCQAPEAASEAVYLNSRLIGAELTALGISVNCAPVVDVPAPGSPDGVIGDRAFGADPKMVARLGRAAAQGFLGGGVLPVIKHMPGHGRAILDSHLALPMVETSGAELDATDFAVFRNLNDLPLAMTGHVVFRAIDSDLPATLSAPVIERVIRGDIGFQGLLFSDDLSMGALSGDIGQRVGAALAAGCDVALHCNGNMAEMNQAALAAQPLDGMVLRRAETALRRLGQAAPFDRAEALARIGVLLGTGT